MLRVFFEAEPWALPGTVALSVVALAVSPSVARQRGGNAFGWWFFLSSVGGFAAVTMTPMGGHFSAGFSRHVIRSMSPSLPSIRAMHSVNEVSLNVLAGIPLGLAAVLLAYQLRRVWPVLACALPFLSELVQGVLPGLNRVGFVMGDAVTNLLGVAIGVMLGLVLVGIVQLADSSPISSGIEKPRVSPPA